MNENTIFINCARGPIVDNEALAKALNDGKLGYACVDVFDMEPPIPADYPLLQAKNTLLTPHQAFISEESMVRRAKIVFDNVTAYLDGKPVNVYKVLSMKGSFVKVSQIEQTYRNCLLLPSIRQKGPVDLF